MRIAVIDSGVYPAHPHISRVAGGVTIAADGTVEDKPYLDAMGHGTAVMAAIQEKAPDADYFAVKVFHSSLRTTVLSLLKAMEWSIAERMDIINLSLGTQNPEHAGMFRPVVQLAVDADIALVSATGAYPGCLPGVFQAGVDPTCEREEFNVDATTGILYASGYPRDAPGIPRERNLNGISFAVANITGFLAQLYPPSGTQRLERLRRAIISRVNANNASGP